MNHSQKLDKKNFDKLIMGIIEETLRDKGFVGKTISQIRHRQTFALYMISLKEYPNLVLNRLIS